MRLRAGRSYPAVRRNHTRSSVEYNPRIERHSFICASDAGEQNAGRLGHSAGGYVCLNKVASYGNCLVLVTLRGGKPTKLC
jgi:hypothetical protein